MKQSEMLEVLKELHSDLLRYAAGSDSIVPGAYEEALDAAIETLERIRWTSVKRLPELPMAEYIDREKLLSDIEKYHLSDGKFQHWVEIQPTVDVEHVIRCKDCHYSRELNREDPKERQFIEGCVWCMNWEYGVFPDDYCSNAKRRKDTNGDKNN